MSGICGWSNNQLPHEKGSSILLEMASLLSINLDHITQEAFHESCALAAVGTAKGSGVYQQNGIFVCTKGQIRWKDSGLAELAEQQGSAQALYEAYQRDDIQLLDLLSGSFVLAIVNVHTHRTLIAIDRLGIESLFYSVRQGQLIFSSNARAIQCHPAADGGIDPQAIYDYLYFHMVPSPRSIFNGVEKLMPGQYLLFEGQQLIKEFYWQPQYVENTRSTLTQLKSSFFDILQSSVARASTGSRTGAFLSGGTDSSTVSGMLRKIAGKSVETYSIDFNAEGFDETEYARLAAKHFDTHPHEYYLTPDDVVEAIPLIAAAYDEPFGNASAVPAYYCAKMARADGLDTLLAGDGGDELFGGNERYATQRIFEYYQLIPKIFRKYLIEPAIFNLPLVDRIRLISKAQGYIKQSNTPLPDRLENYNFLNRIPVGDIFSPEFLATINVDEPLDLLRQTYRRAQTQSSLNRMLYLDLKFTLADNDLRKVSRMCELAQIQVNYPLLDEELLQFSNELPTSLKLRGLKLRYFFKHALRDFLPPEIITKTKHGFGLPFGIWMNTHAPLRELSQRNLHSLSQRGIVRPEFIQEIQRLHGEYPNYYGVMIWILMMLEQWFQSQGKP
ncbi:MAG: asparagine synthase-related protein [Methylococcaceae bacterium]|nr:asparagine synthase-related protein [Methylococcaceae bacterium]